ncbi:flavodoxin domain-containing protein [Agaribacterium sp. ZY112]|uniref:flavodoxin domain-containing protein n=1 Tax=Agaribacterium sp. ZY112 TaxID=3233574 RepID=UPI003523B8E4
MAKFYIIVGSVMGTAQGVAETLTEKLNSLGHTAVCDKQYQQGSLTDKLDHNLLLICSTTGMGDLPANMQALAAELRDCPPNIYQKPYAQISLGDSSYPNFAQAGFTLADLMQGLAAKRLCDDCIIDAQDNKPATKIALEWLENTLLSAI